MLCADQNTSGALNTTAICVDLDPSLPAVDAEVPVLKMPAEDTDATPTTEQSSA